MDLQALIYDYEIALQERREQALELTQQFCEQESSFVNGIVSQLDEIIKYLKELQCSGHELIKTPTKKDLENFSILDLSTHAQAE
jgi:hypothetical protein